MAIEISPTHSLSFSLPDPVLSVGLSWSMLLFGVSSRNYEFSGNPRSIAACIGEPKADKGHEGGARVKPGSRNIGWQKAYVFGMGVM